VVPFSGLIYSLVYCLMYRSAARVLASPVGQPIPGGSLPYFGGVEVQYWLWTTKSVVGRDVMILSCSSPVSWRWGIMKLSLSVSYKFALFICFDLISVVGFGVRFCKVGV